MDPEKLNDRVNDKVEIFLAQLYVDRSLREQFLLDPIAIASRYGLSPDQCRSLAMMPVQDLQTAARSFESKRRFKAQRGYGARLKDWAIRRSRGA
jgi:hypothetical protein